MKGKSLFKKFKKFRKNHTSNLNIFVVCVSIIMIWRWIWNILDMYIFPNNPLVSNLICIVLWIIILLIDDWRLLELEENPHRWKNN